MKPFRIWWTSFAGLAFCLIYPSAAIFKKLGYPLLFIYALAVVLLLFLSIAWLVPRISRTLLSPWRSRLVMGLMGASVLIAFLAIHPRIDTQGFHLAGRSFGASDGDDAIDLVITELCQGHYPYYAKTFLGNPITPMPGSILLALPFYVLGQSALQNIFWLGLFLVLITRYYHHQVAVVLAFLILCLSPNVLYHVFQGGDYIANGIYLLVFTALLCESARQRRPFWISVLWAMLLGIGLSSRPNFVLIVPLVYMALMSVTSAKAAAMLLVTSLASFSVITLPFLIYDPCGFSPLHTAAKLNVGGMFPWAPVVVPAIGGALALFLALRRKTYALPALMQDIFVVQTFVILAGAILASVRAGRLDLESPHFGILFMFFGIFVFGFASLSKSGALAEISKVTSDSSRQTSS
ncbi:MAG: hypothetical protein O3C57_01870 [Verrucomicrobia bacterium]|nr:hypothetical protein [Verrucomicrobiota bacterium]